MAYVRDGHSVSVDLQGGSWGSGDGWSGSRFTAAMAEWEFDYMPWYNPSGEAHDYNLLTRMKQVVRPGYRFLGIGSNSSHILWGTDGWLDNNYPDRTGDWLSGCYTVYALWQMIAVPMVFDQNGGTQIVDPIYYSIERSQWYGDINLETTIYSVPVPERSGFAFTGYYSAASGGTCYVDSTGAFTPAFNELSPTDTVTVYAQWIDVSHLTYTLTFDPDGGTTPTASKSVTIGYPVGVLPKPTKSGFCFKGWYLDGKEISSDSIWTLAANATAVAAWGMFDGYVEDWFGFGSSALIPISSDSGDNRQHVCVSHTGQFEPDVDQVSCIWRNPTVTYRVIKNTTFATFLGKAFAATMSDSTMTVSGFMITSVEVKTKIGEFPTVTVSAHANEGANAINQFQISIPIEASAHAQNLLSAVSGGGVLQALDIRATCEPVVCQENLAPCASDVVRGKMMVSAKTLAPYGEAAPTAGNSFVALGVPTSGSDGVFPTWSFNAEKGL